MKMVQKFVLCIFLGVFTFGKLFAATPDDLIFHYHFVGTTAVTKSTDAGKLKEVWALAESKILRDNAVQNLSRASLKFFGGNSTSTNQAALLRPLFDDLIAAESVVELRGTTNSGIIFAVKLSTARQQLWETNLLQLTKGSKPHAVKLNEFSGWQTQIARDKKTLKFFRAGPWTLVALGPNQAAWHSDFVKRLSSSNAEKNWLDANVDWSKLNSLIPLDFIPFKLARTEIKIAGSGENLRTTMRVVYPGKIDWKPAAWQMPVDAIRDPLISFTAAQRIAPFLKPSKTFQQFQFNPLTNQIYFWAQSQMPFQTYVAMPVKNSTNVMKTFGPQLATAFNDDLQRRDGGTLNMASNRVELLWQGLPIIVPFLGPTKEKDGSEFLLGGLFPLVRTTNAPPAELFGQVSGQKDLVFYDWEITQARLSQWMLLSQMLPVFPKELVSIPNDPEKRKRLVPGKFPERKWITAIAPLLGNTITQVTYKAPNEVSVVRKSHLGLNSVEIILLSHWLADPKFPAHIRFDQPVGATTEPSRSTPAAPK